VISTMPTLLVFALLAVAGGPDKGEAVTVAEAKTDADGFLVHEVRSPYQAGTTRIRVLLPDKPEEGKRYPVVFVLPVEAGTESRFGDGLVEVRKHGLPSKLQAIFVAPTFSHLPWYADHPTQAAVRQETYFLDVVVPFVEKTYPVRAGAGGRFLLGFSKSGWGAFSLLLRHPDAFARAAAWDAPLMMDRPGAYGSGEVFGSPENFENYRIARLLKERAAAFRKEKRLMVLGYGNFRDQHQKAHALMTDLEIAHEYRDGPARKHDWHSGWVVEAAEWLLAAQEGKSR
jgi:S-formylglutathione hydrolase FrmB